GVWLQKIPLLGGMFGSLGGPVGALISGLATLALTSPQARDALFSLAGTLASTLAPTPAQLAPLVAELGTTPDDGLAAGIQSLIPLVPALVVVLEATLKVVVALVPVIDFLARVLAAIMPVLGPLIVAWKVWGAVTAAYTAILNLNLIAQARNQV